MHRQAQRTIINAIYDKHGTMRHDVQRAVDDAIKRYPNMNADMWLGGVAAVSALLEAIGVDVDGEFESDNPPRGGYPAARSRRHTKGDDR